MSDPVSTSIATYFSITKIWSITSGVCGSIIPILALADKTKIRLSNAFFMALTGSSFSIFVGPYLAQKLEFTTVEGMVALCWVMGATGVFLIRAILKWLDQRGVTTIDKVVDKILDITKLPPPSMPESSSPTEKISNDNHVSTTN